MNAHASLKSIGLFVLVLTLSASGCSSKNDQSADLTISENRESLPTGGTNTVTPAAGSETVVSLNTASPVIESPESLPSQNLSPAPAASLIPALASNSSERNRQIQVALANAQYYTGNIDGKVGPMTKEAIRKFQEANGLSGDGRVGAKTWSLLGRYAATAAESESADETQR